MKLLHFLITKASHNASYIAKGSRWFVACLCAFQMIACDQAEPEPAPDPEPEILYDPADVAVINRLIDENDLSLHGNKLTKANPADGTYIPDDWRGFIDWRWQYDRNLNRITRLEFLDSVSLKGKVDVSSLNKLWTLYFAGTEVTAIKASNMDSLKRFIWIGNLVTRDSPDLSGSNSLEFLQLTPGLLSSPLDLSGKERLTYLNVGGCKLDSLDVSSCKQLETLVCGANRLTSLNLRGLLKLKSYVCNVQAVFLTLTGSGSKYSVDIPLESPVFSYPFIQNIDKKISYSEGKLISIDTTVTAVSFQVETGIDASIPPKYLDQNNRGLSGTLYLTYKDVTR
ncbi:MAG: hypothetical protein LBH04_06590 [Tannerellaceae bacterium]|jgi:hypothetical protein|nr:hypothetical protein [Tannerellaceae bacterium]